MTNTLTGGWTLGTMARRVSRGRTRFYKNQKVPVHPAAPRYAGDGRLLRPSGWYVRIDLPPKKNPANQSENKRQPILAFLYQDEISHLVPLPSEPNP